MKKTILTLLTVFSFIQAMGQSMEWLCRPDIYTDIDYMGHDLFKVKTANNKWGVISASGEEILKAEHDSITVFVENRALLLDKAGNRLLGIIGAEGEIIKSFANEKVYVSSYPYYKEGLLNFKQPGNPYPLFGYLDLSGNVSIAPNFYFAAPFNDGIATVQYTEGYYGLIKTSGHSAISTDTKYEFLSSMVDGYLYAITKTRLGNELRIMRRIGSQLKSEFKLEGGQTITELSDNNSSLSCTHTDHLYYIDNQWRISGVNYYNHKLPYKLESDIPLITESSELLSKHEFQGGIQITYLGNPILEEVYSNVETYEKKYAIVRAKDKSIGVLKLNPSAGIEIIEPTRVIDFYHNPQVNQLPAKSDIVTTPERYIELRVDIRDLDFNRLKCYINEDGVVRQAPLKRDTELWKLYLPYFCADTKFENTIPKEIDIAITYDGLDWMHRKVMLSSKHKEGFEVSISGNNTTNDQGNATIYINVETINGNSSTSASITIPGIKSRIISNTKEVISIPVSVPEGKSRTFNYVVTIEEEGCPIIKKQVSKTITNPQKEKKIKFKR